MKRILLLAIMILVAMAPLSASLSKSESTIAGSYVLDLDKLYIVLDADHGHIEDFRFKQWNDTFDITPVAELDGLRPFSAISSGYDENHILGGQALVTSTIIKETMDTVIIKCENEKAMIIYSFYKTKQFFDVQAVGYETWSYVMRYSFIPEEYATNVEQGTWVEKQVLVTEPWVAVEHEDLAVVASWNQITNNSNHVTLDNSETVPLPPGKTAKGVDIGDLWTVGSRIPAGVALWFRIGAYFSADPWYQPAKDQLEESNIVKFSPESLNVKSKGKWITAFIELPGTDPCDINISTILLNGTIPAQARPLGKGDEDGDGIPNLMIKFERAEVIALILSNGVTQGRFMTVVLAVTGKLDDGTSFEGSNTIKIILPTPRCGRCGTYPT